MKIERWSPITLFPCILRQLELRFSKIIVSMAETFIGVPIVNKRLKVLCYVIAATNVMVIGAVVFLVYERVSNPRPNTFKAIHFCFPTKLSPRTYKVYPLCPSF